jgi:hypothetical protein
VIYPHRVAIERADPVTSASGETLQPSSWPVVASNVEAFIQPRSGSYRQMDFGTAHPSTHRGFFEIVDLQTGDRVVHNGVRYLVTFVANQFGHHLEADLQQVLVP